KNSSENWLHAEDWEKVGGNEQGVHLLCFPRSGQAERIVAPHRHRGKCVIVFLPVAEFWIRNRSPLKVRLAFAQGDELVGLRIRQGIEENTIDHRKQRSIRAYAERDGDDDQTRQARRLEKLAKCVTQILKYAGHR